MLTPTISGNLYVDHPEVVFMQIDDLMKENKALEWVIYRQICSEIDPKSSFNRFDCVRIFNHRKNHNHNLKKAFNFLDDMFKPWISNMYKPQTSIVTLQSELGSDRLDGLRVESLDEFFFISP